MVHARLGIAEENSGKLVSYVRSEARLLGEERKLNLILTDGPPGIGCPVVASLGGAAAALIVVEPTISGIHDMQADVIIAGGMGQRAMSLFEQKGITVITGAPPLEPEALVESYLENTLATGENVCDH